MILLVHNLRLEKRHFPPPNQHLQLVVLVVLMELDVVERSRLLIHNKQLVVNFYFGIMPQGRFADLICFHFEERRGQAARLRYQQCSRQHLTVFPLKCIASYSLLDRCAHNTSMLHDRQVVPQILLHLVLGFDLIQKLLMHELHAPQVRFESPKQLQQVHGVYFLQLALVEAVAGRLYLGRILLVLPVNITNFICFTAFLLIYNIEREVLVHW